MEPTFPNVILAATDFSPIGDYAIDQAANMAKKMNSQMYVVHVINKNTRNGMLKGNANPDPVKSRLEDITRRIRDEYGIEARYLAPEGSIFTTIADTARDVQANFLFLGTHGKKGIQFLLGSFALKVVKSSPAPMVVVQKPANNNDFRNVIYPLDLESGSKQKVNWAIFLHQHFNSNIHILVYNIKDDSTQRKLKADLHQVEKILQQNGVSFTSTVADTRGSFDRQIIDFAREKKADTIMISTDPEALTWNPFGTLPERIIYNKEKIPVICINSKNLKVSFVP